jgi:hypothetical protein
MHDMATTTTREFIRHFARLKKAAANGDEVIVRDRQGQAYVFRAKGSGPSLGEQLADLRGALRTGTRVKRLHGFGHRRILLASRTRHGRQPAQAGMSGVKP